VLVKELQALGIVKVDAGECTDGFYGTGIDTLRHSTSSNAGNGSEE
jgi:hypothetical protein